jgi:hypothetical protein
MTTATTALVHFNHIETAGLTGWPDMRTSDWKPNYGDMLVCIALLRMLDTGPTLRTDFGNTRAITAGRAVIRGSTYLHRNFDFAAANRTLDAIDAPLAIIGLGAQNPTLDPQFLDGHDGARDFIARLNERGASISVRGAFSAEVVARLGGRNIRVTGCPSMFYTLSCPKVRLPEMLKRPERRLGLSLHTGLSQNIFCHSPAAARRMHGHAFAFALKNASNVALFEQGVMREYDVADRDLGFGRRVAAAEAVHAAMAGGDPAPGFTPYDLIARMVSVKSIEEWLAKARDLDAIIGFRFHGNMVALLQGGPCFYYVYDSRLAEFCALYGLPAQDVTEPFRDPVRQILDHDWDRANARIAACHTEMRAFLAENALPNRLG